MQELNELKVNVHPIHSQFINSQNVKEKLNFYDGILVAPGFGERGVEGKIEAIRHVRIIIFHFLEYVMECKLQ